MDNKREVQDVQDYDAKISKMISEGGIGVSAYYDYEDLNKDPLKEKPQEETNHNKSSSPPST